MMECHDRILDHYGNDPNVIDSWGNDFVSLMSRITLTDSHCREKVLMRDIDPLLLSSQQEGKNIKQDRSGSGFESELPPTRRVIKMKPERPRGSRRKKPEKKERLWEFIRDLLFNDEYCPSLICWDNYEEGIFRFVHSDKVAKLWGSEKGNPNMNYEKLSRAMRYYYKSKILQPVLGRKYVYKFGPKVMDWRTPNPNYTNFKILFQNCLKSKL